MNIRTSKLGVFLILTILAMATPAQESPVELTSSKQSSVNQFQQESATVSAAVSLNDESLVIENSIEKFVEETQKESPENRVSEFKRDPVTGTLKVEAAKPHDVLLTIWSAKQTVLAHIDICAAHGPNAIAKGNQLREDWIRKNRRAVNNVEKYMRNYLEMNRANFSQDMTIESRLIELVAREIELVQNTFLASSKQKDAVCNSLKEPLTEMTQDFRNLYRQNRKLVRTAFNEVKNGGELETVISKN